MNLGNFLRSLRFRNNYSVAYVIEKIGISESTYYNIENNKVLPKLSILEKLAKLYNKTVPELLSGKDNESLKNDSEQRIMKKLTQIEKKLDELVDYIREITDWPCKKLLKIP